jgi:hypothetical protein
MGGRLPAALLAVVLVPVVAGCGLIVPIVGPVASLPDPSTPGSVQTLAPSPATTLRVPLTAFEPVAVGAGVPKWFVAAAVSFADADHGWIAGTAGGDGAFALETVDGGRTWTATQVGAYVSQAIAIGPGGTVWVSTACAEGEPDGCVPALQRRDADGSWEVVGDLAPLEIDFAGESGALAVALPNGRRRPDGTRVPVLQVTSDGGATWSGPINPCGAMELRGITTPREDEVVVACGGVMAADQGVTLTNRLLRSTDAGETWVEVSATEAGNVLPGKKVGLDIAADGSGLWWGAFTPAMATTDGGGTWTALSVADGDRHIAGAGSSIGAGAGYLVVGERLMWTADGEHWEDRATFPEPPCCGG